MLYKSSTFVSLNMAPRKTKVSGTQRGLFDSVPTQRCERDNPEAAQTITEISSDQILDAWDTPFRVLAGPGAGKTHWLANHIAHVVRNSPRLHRLARVACISYTNVATERLQRALEGRLGPSASRADVSTIHAFLYRVFVAPYIGLIHDPATGRPLVPPNLLDGHDEHRPAHDKIETWLNGALKKGGMALFRGNEASLRTVLKRLLWRLENGKLVLRAKRPYPDYFPATQLEQYKFLYWQEGIIDHEDVLYFAYRIVTEHADLMPFVTATYPYLYLDEFQDTNPLQTAIVKAFAAAGAVVGVVGDRRQAIYAFHGAAPEDFEEFRILGQADYFIPGNRRSTRSIISVLNHVRGGDLIQSPHRDDVGEPVRLLVGAASDCMAHIVRVLPAGSELVVLARQNAEAASFRTATGASQANVWQLFEEADRHRYHLMRGITEAFIYSSLGTHGLGTATLQRHIRMRGGQLREPFTYKYSVSDLDRRALVVHILSSLLNDRDALLNGSALDAYQRVSTAVAGALAGAGLTKARTGAFASFAATTPFRVLVDSMDLVEDTRKVRTIHKAKGEEFDNVVVLVDEATLRNLVFPREPIEHGEESNVRYVALSRARERLFIAVPALSDGEELRLTRLQLPLEVRRLELLT